MPARDVFLCHAYVDKKTHVRPLADALARRAVSCWVDEAQIHPGESIIDAISEGIENAHFVLVLITENFIARNWTQKELNAALSREIRTGAVVVLPILAMDRETYLHKYPLLADKLYLDWSEGPEALADKVAARFGRQLHSEWHYSHPTDYVGLVWVRVLPQPKHLHQPYRLTLRWGPYIKQIELIPENEMPISFVHHKTNTDNIMLLASIEPASIVTFGQGPPPDLEAINIDEGWTRTAGGQWPGHL